MDKETIEVLVNKIECLTRELALIKLRAIRVVNLADAQAVASGDAMYREAIRMLDWSTAGETRLRGEFLGNDFDQ